ncbi:HU family DNA-binding protein [Chitinasiproducens palmae]|uniref:DNA-binding protein n=1 Tax=Chitinasiproducens palmae TaxID=1770053 RepID=A0A1H2PII8_9BURK|nr:HU family DNA-binding protein [Chitinasiproducens palmae]SDV46106.1 DNA-binding protein [Chitinasiproducens palmae]
MATTKKAAAKAPAAKKQTQAAAKPAAKSARAAKPAAAALKPIKESFTKSSLAVHIAEQSGVEPKAVKAVLATLEQTMVASLHKKGLGQFALPGLLKVDVQAVPAKKKRFGKDPFTGEERWFPAKPASTRVKVRALKKLKDAAL